MSFAFHATHRHDHPMGVLQTNPEVASCMLLQPRGCHIPSSSGFQYSPPSSKYAGIVSVQDWLSPRNGREDHLLSRAATAQTTPLSQCLPIQTLPTHNACGRRPSLKRPHERYLAALVLAAKAIPQRDCALVSANPHISQRRMAEKASISL